MRRGTLSPCNPANVAFINQTSTSQVPRQSQGNEVSNLLWHTLWLELLSAWVGVEKHSSLRKDVLQQPSEGKASLTEMSEVGHHGSRACLPPNQKYDLVCT